MTKESSPDHISKTNIETIYLPHLKGNNASFTLISEEEGWKGAVLFISNDDKDYRSIANVNKQSTCGYVVKFTNEALIVVLYSSKLFNMASANLALVEREVIQLQSVELIDKNKIS